MKVTNKQQLPDMKYTFCGQELHVVSSQTHPYLGIKIDSKPTGTHIGKNIITKANRVLGCLRRNLWFCSRRVKEMAYRTLVWPMLEYASMAWEPYHWWSYQPARSYSMQSSKILHGVPQTKEQHHQHDQRIGMGLTWDQNRRQKARLTMMFKIANDLVGINKEEHLVPIYKRLQNQEKEQQQFSANLRKT